MPHWFVENVESFLCDMQIIILLSSTFSIVAGKVSNIHPKTVNQKFAIITLACRECKVFHLLSNFHA